MRARGTGFVTSLVLGSALTALSACGGGGGGSGPTTPTLPGTLGAIALEGGSAPGTGAGTFGAFGPSTLIDVADGGWTAFVATVAGGTSPKGLFVRRPDGVVVNVYLKNDAVPVSPSPYPGVGSILDFVRIWISPGIGTGAIVTAYVTITGSSVEGLVSARVPSNGAATEKTGVIYLGRALPTSRQALNTGNLVTLDPDLVQVDDQGDVFFIGVGSNAVNGVWTINRLGETALYKAVAASGDFAPVNGTLGQAFDALGIDSNGLIVAYAVDVFNGPTHAIIAQNNFQNSGVLVAQNTGQPPNVGARSFESVYGGGPIHVTTGSGTAFVVWEGNLTGAAPDIGVFTRQVLGGNILGLGSLLTMAYPGEGISGLGGGAFVTNIRLLDASLAPNRIPIFCDIGGGTSNRALFSAPDAATLTGVVAQGQTAPAPGGTTFTSSFPSLTIDGIKHGDYLGSLALSAVLANGSSGVFWAVFGSLFFQVVRQGDVAPGTSGGTFGSFAVASPVLTASSFVVFTSTVAGGSSPSGLFIQG